MFPSTKSQLFTNLKTPFLILPEFPVFQTDTYTENSLVMPTFLPVERKIKICSSEQILSKKKLSMNTVQSDESESKFQMPRPRHSLKRLLSRYKRKNVIRQDYSTGVSGKTALE